MTENQITRKVRVWPESKIWQLVKTPLGRKVIYANANLLFFTPKAKLLCKQTASAKQAYKLEVQRDDVHEDCCIWGFLAESVSLIDLI